MLKDVIDKVPHLQLVGLSGPQAEVLTDQIDVQQPALSGAGVDERIGQLLASLHEGSWYSFGGANDTLVGMCGGRQECRFCTTVLNIVCSKASSEIQATLKAEAIALFPNLPTAQAWASETAAIMEVITSSMPLF